MKETASTTAKKRKNWEREEQRVQVNFGNWHRHTKRLSFVLV